MPGLRMFVACLIFVAGAAACKSSSNTDNPGTTPAPSPSPSPVPGTSTCRNYANVYSFVGSASGLTDSRTATARYDTATNQITTTGTISISTGCTGNYTTVTSFNSVADFVGEVAVVPPVGRYVRAESTATLCTGVSTGTTTGSYDAQGRITQTINTARAVDGTTTTTTGTYTAWDSSGRPTAVTINASGVIQNATMAYDNAARTQTVLASGGGSPDIFRFDQFGNLISASSAGGAATTTYTISSTAQVCR